MITRTFFDASLAKHTADVSRAYGTVLVRLHLTNRVAISVGTILEIQDGFVVVAAYANGKEASAQRKVRDAAKPWDDADHIAVPYEAIAEVEVTGRRLNKHEPGFSLSRK